MNVLSRDGWQRTSPFAILFFVGKIVRVIAQNAWQSIAPLFVYISVGKEDLVTKIVVGGITLALVIVVGSILSWLFFRYRVLDDSVLIRSGVFRKKQLDIKFDRIQGINTQQNPVYRFLDLVTVTFDTAGSSGDEGNLPAVTRDFANALRKQIGSTRSKRTDAGDDADADSLQPLLKLDWRDMVRIGLADRRALIVFALIGPLMEQMGDEIRGYVDEALQSAALNAMQFGVSTGIQIAAAVLVGLLVLFAMISIAAAFLRYHNFELYLDGTTLRSHGGLLTRHEHSIDLQKIQTLRLQQGIVQIWLKRFSMTARQAISGRKQRRKKVFSIPVVTAAQADGLRPLLLAEEAGRLSQDPRDPGFSPVSAYYMRSRILYIGLLPALAFAAFFAVEVGPPGITGLLWLPVVALLAWRNWKRAGYRFDADEIIRRSGLFGYRTVSLLFRKVQRITVTQSHYQRRKGLASLRLYMASGTVNIPYIELSLARQLRDYILYRIESSEKAWH